MKMKLFSRCAGAALCVLISTASAQTAKVPGFELERLELDPFAVGSLVLGTGELPPPQTFRLSLAGQYELKPLVAMLGDRQLGAVVRDRIGLHLAAAYALHERIALGLQIPIVAYQSSDDLSSVGIQSPSSGGFGNPVLIGRLGVLRDGLEAPFDLALQLGLGIPIGSQDALASAGAFSFLPKLMAGKRVRSLFLASVEIGARVTSTIRFRQQDLGSQLAVGASLSTLGARLRGELTYRSGISFSGLPYAAELLGGGRFAVTPRLELFALAGPGFSRAPGSPTFRALIGLAFGGGGRAAAAIVPEPLVDPCAPGNKHTPEQCPELDDDGDGIKNKDDKCPLEPGPPENQGCPVKEPEKPKEKEPEKPKETVTLAPPKLVISEKIYFETGKSRLLPQSNQMLDVVAEFLKKHPELKRVLIEGHTDSTGPMALNMNLSQARAESVRRYLISKKVSASRLSAKGYGPTRPVASNDTPEGREKNRRVEFTIIEPKQSTGALDESAPPSIQRPRPSQPKTKPKGGGRP